MPSGGAHQVQLGVQGVRLQCGHALEVSAGEFAMRSGNRGVTRG